MLVLGIFSRKEEDLSSAFSDFLLPDHLFAIVATSESRGLHIVDLKDEEEEDFTWPSTAGFAAAEFDDGPFLWTGACAKESRHRIAEEDKVDGSFWEFKDTEGEVITFFVKRFSAQEGLAILEETGCRMTGAELFRFRCASVAASGNGTSSEKDGMEEIEEYFRELRFACSDDCGSISADCESNIRSLATGSVETGLEESSSSP